MQSLASVSANWLSFSHIKENKTEFEFLATSIQETRCGKILVSTKDQLVVSSSDADLEELHPCNQEEAYTRAMLHVDHCAKNGFKRVSIRTGDTYVVVLATACYQRLEPLGGFWNWNTFLSHPCS